LLTRTNERNENSHFSNQLLQYVVVVLIIDHLKWLVVSCTSYWGYCLIKKMCAVCSMPVFCKKLEIRSN
jgi:hypothetical protein